MGENPSYWGADPEYDNPEATTLAADSGSDIEDPKEGDMLYAVDLDEREKYLSGKEANTYRVHIGFLREGHDENIKGLANIPEGDGEVYTMYEKETGMYSAPFPKDVDKYGEIGFALVKKDGQASPENPNSRHFNFRGKTPEAVGESANKFGYFKYHSGYTDTYYMNTRQDDSYWGAHPSDVNQSLDSQVLYINVEDSDVKGENANNDIIADPDKMMISWNEMPQNDKYVKDEELGVSGYKITNTLPHKWIRYFQFPKNSNATENTILTIHFKLKALPGATLTKEQEEKVYSYKFTYVPRSQRNRVNMDYIWEFNGKMWEHFEAGEGVDPRDIYFASVRNKYTNVWMRVAGEDGKYVDKAEIENWDGTVWPSEWIEKHVVEIKENNKTTTWLKLDTVEDTKPYHKEKGKLFSLTIPGKYTKIQFRTELDSKFYYTKGETITDESAYPCYFAYQIGDPSVTVPESTQGVTGLTGYWASVYATNAAGDQSVDIPEDTLEWEEGTYYVDTTFYDYYSDIETTGQKVAERDVSKWNTSDIEYHYRLQAKVFNAALDAYYRENVDNNRTDYPALYLAQFSGNNYDHSWDNMFNDGKEYWNHGQLGPKRQNAWTKAGGGPNYGLAAKKLSKDGDILIEDEKDPNVEMPFFNEEFLRGNNSMDTAVGNVYKNVKFPVTMDTTKDSPTEGYWVYDSSRDSDAFRLSKDVNNGYFMKRTGKGINFRGRNAFYPFNDVEDWGEGYIIDKTNNTDPEMAKANLLFGSRLEFPFTMTEDGVVHDQDGGEHDITFQFQGDDDTWVYIDGILVLDMGGNHDAVRGTINLTDGTYEIRRNLGTGYNGDGTVDDKPQGKGKLPQELIDSLKDPSKSHKVTMFYMERGLYESNLKLTFNFPRENRFTVEKDVDVESTRVEGEDDIFAGLLENMGGFNFNLKNQVTSGEKVAVEDTPGYRQPGARTPLFDAVTSEKKDADFVFINDAGTIAGDSGGIRTIKQTSEIKGTIPDEKDLLKIDPGEPMDVKDKDYLRLSMKNLGVNDRNAQNLYFSFVDSDGKRVGGYAGSYGYNGESNTFITDEDSVIRLDFKQMSGDANEFNWGSVDYMLIGIRRNNPETEAAEYEISYAAFFEALKDKEPIGFYVDDSQISDYGSYESGTLSPADGAWYMKQDKGADGKYDRGVSWNAEEGTFNLADGQRAVFTDKFRTGSYIALKENVNPKIFDTEWTLKEGGQNIEARYLLNTRHDNTTVENPLSVIEKEEPLKEIEGTEVYDKRKEILDPKWSGNEKFQEPDTGKTIVYRSYKDPDSSANLGTDLNVEVKNTLKRGTITIKKQLTEDMKQNDGTYKPARFTFKIYYTNVAGRSLEKQLEPVENDQRYLVQTVTVRTNDKGVGETTVHNIPAGTKYWIEEVPENGTELTKIEIEKQGQDVSEPHEGVEIIGGDDGDYRDAYVVGTAYASDQAVTFTNNIRPFYMDIEKIWRDDLTDDEREELGITEVHIRLERKLQDAPEDEWKSVTKDYFGNSIVNEEDYLVLNKENDWKTTSSRALDVVNGDHEYYEYRILELNHQGILKFYEVTYHEDREEDYEAEDGKKYLHVTYQAINTPADLRLQKEWANPGDEDTFSRIQVKLMASADYDPQDPDKEVDWVCYKKLSNPHHNCNSNCYISLSKDGSWRTSLDNLPLEQAEGQPYYYKLADEQILINGGWKDVEDISDLCTVTYGEPVTLYPTADEIVTVTLKNKLQNIGNIRIIKEGKNQKKLEGAEFKIERLKEDKDKPKNEWKVDDSWTPKTAVTNDKGEILFGQLPYATYRITETKAPHGYLLDPEGLIITIPCKNGQLDKDPGDVEVEVKDKDGGTNIVLTIKNSELYKLPSTGGPGIYLYMIGGVLLMSAAMFLLYGKKRKRG